MFVLVDAADVVQPDPGSATVTVPWGAEAEGPRPLLGQARDAYHLIVVGGRGVEADGLINGGAPRGKTVWPPYRRGTARR